MLNFKRFGFASGQSVQSMYEDNVLNNGIVLISLELNPSLGNVRMILSTLSSTTETSIGGGI